MGIEILPPDTNESQADFSVVDGKIRFGLAAVKNVGMKAVESVIEEREKNGPFHDLFEFSSRVAGSKVNRRVLEGLILCGAFDFTGVYRSRLFSVLDDVVKYSGANHDPNQLNMFGSTDLTNGSSMGLFEFPEIDEWDERKRLREEKETLGFYITGHPLAGFNKLIDHFATCVIQDLSEQKDKSQVKIAGVIESIKIRRTKRGDKMAILRVEDLTGSTEVVVFPDVFNKTSHLLKDDEPLFIEGSAEISENMAKILSQEIVTLNSIKEKSVKAIELNLDQESISKELLEDLRSISFRFPGKCRLLFRVNGSNGDEDIVIVANDLFSVMPCNELIDEIETVTGNKVQKIGIG